MTRHDKEVMMKGSGKHILIILMMVAIACSFIGCEQTDNAPMGTLSVSVSGMNDSKTISPDGYNEITHYMLKAVSSNGNESFSSDYLSSKAGTYVIEGLPFGTYTVKADGYSFKDGAYVLVATGEEGPVTVRSSGTSDIHIVLDRLADTASGDVLIDLILPSGTAMPATASITLDDGDGMVIEGDVPVDAISTYTATITLDADNLFGNGEILAGGSWFLSGDLHDVDGNILAVFSEVLNLQAGLGAEGTVVAFPVDGIGEGNPYVRLIAQSGSGIVFLGSEGPVDSEITILVALNGTSDIDVLLDDETVEPVIEKDGETGGWRITVAGLKNGISTITMTADDGSSMTLRVYDLTGSPVIPGIIS